MTKTPTQEEIDSNPALAALQALKYEDDDPVGMKIKLTHCVIYHYSLLVVVIGVITTN